MARNPRLLDIGTLKAIYTEAGLIPPAELDEADGDTPAAIDADPQATGDIKAIEDRADPSAEMADAARARRLLLELDLMMLEAA